MNPRSAFLSAILTLSLPGLSLAHIIGTNTPAQPLTVERVAALPAWQTYLANSQRQRQIDLGVIVAELKARQLTNASSPPKSASPRTPLDQSTAWYASPEARRMADIVVSFQTPAGGWSKHTDFTRHVRAPGELFTSDNNSRFVLTKDFDRAENAGWSYVGTFDNDATTTELRFLAKVISANPTNAAPWQKAFLHGLDYIFAAQYPNGGWPQVWPLQGGYHDAITFNDDALLNIVKLLRGVALGEPDFKFVPVSIRAQAEASWQKGLDCILATQVREQGRRTVWGQQYDPLTLLPVAARNYEMPSLSSGESATLVLYLMQLPKPDARVVAAVHAAAAWFEKTKIQDRVFKSAGREGRKLLDSPGSGPLWSRYYEIGTDQPIFGDRDQTIHDDVNEISRERRVGYGWFKDSGKRVLEHYAKWAKQHPLKPE
jgi:PelA/Pel-15E family pectate lyase